MELRHLRYFVAVAEQLHFGRAAQALATAQPSLSRQIAQLEDELGVVLFDRTNRRVELTDAGRRFLVDARRTLQAAAASARHARESADGTRGELRLGFLPGAMLVQLPVVLREHRRRFPNVTVVPTLISSPEHVPALVAATVDVAWTIPVTDPDVVSQTVARERLLLALPVDHRLTRRRRRVAVKDCIGERLVLMDRATTPMLHDATLNICLSNGFRPTEIEEVHDVLSLLGFVAAGFGIAFAPKPWSAIHMNGLTFRELDADFTAEEALSWHRDRDTPIVRSFVATAVDVLAS